jgi:hypothetical protein
VAVILVAVIGALGAIGAAAVGYANRQKLTEIHVLVNSRLDTAIREIEDLKQQRNRLQEKEDDSPDE